MTDAREALAALIYDCMNLNRAVLADARDIADAILGAGWTTPGERVKPSVEDVARALATVGASYNYELPADDEWEGWVKEARAVLTLFEKGAPRG